MIFETHLFIEDRLQSESDEQSVEGAVLHFGVNHKVAVASNDFDAAVCEKDI